MFEDEGFLKCHVETRTNDDPQNTSTTRFETDHNQQTLSKQSRSRTLIELAHPKTFITDVEEQEGNQTSLYEPHVSSTSGSTITFERAIKELNELNSGTKTRKERNVEDPTSCKKLLCIFKWTAKACYILCPPLPNLMIRKAAFHPPKHCHYYFLIGGEKNKREQFLDAKSALKSTNLTLCLPHLLLPEFMNSDVVDQLLRVQVHLVRSGNGDILVVLYIRCERSYRCKRSAPCVVLFAQPNSSDIGSCMLSDPNLVDMADFLQCDLMTFDYSGFGLSTGTPTEKNVYQNIDAVYQYLIKELKTGPDDIILIGFSMGTAATIYLASHEKVDGLVLIAPFTSLFRVIGQKPSSSRTCCLDQFTNIDKAPKVSCPTLICHGMNDFIVSMNHSTVLHSLFPNAVQPFYLDKATHQSIFRERKMWDRIQNFLFYELGVSAKWSREMEARQAFFDYDF